MTHRETAGPGEQYFDDDLLTMRRKPTAEDEQRLEWFDDLCFWGMDEGEAFRLMQQGMTAEQFIELRRNLIKRRGRPGRILTTDRRRRKEDHDPSLTAGERNEHTTEW